MDTGIAYANLVTESVSDPDSYRDQTTLTWSNESITKYPMNIMVSIKEKMPAKDMDASLSTLNNFWKIITTFTADNHPAYVQLFNFFLSSKKFV